jgi:hypothetical protein
MWSEHCSYKSSRVLAEGAADQGALGHPSARARMPASSISARAWPPSSRWKATTTPASSSPTTARRRASAASCAMSSPWARAPSPTSTRCASATPSCPRRARSGRRGARHRRLRQLRGRADRGRRGQLPPRLQRQPPGQRHDGRHPEGRPHLHRGRHGPRQCVVYVGSKTGRDGIHGATMASTEFSADSEEKRPTVQVGDPSPKSCSSKPAWS